MNHFFIITNRDKDMDLSTTNEIKHFLQKKGKTCRTHPAGLPLLPAEEGEDLPDASGGGSRNTLGGGGFPHART